MNITNNLNYNPMFLGSVTKKERELLQQFVKEKKNNKQIALIMGKTENWVYNALRKSKIDSLAKIKREKPIIDLYEKNKTKRQISYILCRPYELVSRIIDEYQRKQNEKLNSNDLILKIMDRLKLSQKDIEKSVIITDDTCLPSYYSREITNQDKEASGFLKDIMYKLNLSENDIKDSVIL